MQSFDDLIVPMNEEVFEQLQNEVISKTDGNSSSILLELLVNIIFLMSCPIGYASGLFCSHTFTACHAYFSKDRTKKASFIQYSHKV